MGEEPTGVAVSDGEPPEPRPRRAYLLAVGALTVLAIAGVLWALLAHTPPFFLLPLVLYLVMWWRRTNPANRGATRGSAPRR